MLTPEYLRTITEATEKATEDFNNAMVEKIVKRILALYNATGDVKLIPSSRNDVLKMMEAGKVYEDIRDEVVKRLPDIEKEIRKAFEDASEEIRLENIRTSAEILEEPADEDVVQGSQLTEKEKRLLQRAYEATDGTIQNLTGTTASTWQTEYINACDEAYWKATHGVSMNQAVREAVDRVAKSGTRVVQYGSGHVDTIEVAIARAVRTGLNQAAAQITLQRAAECGAEYVLVSSHLGARVTDKDEPANHYSWQGKVYHLDWKSAELEQYAPDVSASQKQKGLFARLRDKLRSFFKKKEKYPDFVKTTGYGTGEGLCGWNCRHTFSIFYPKTNENNQIQYDSEENRKAYELSQQQRELERRIRKTKSRMYAMRTGVSEATDPDTAKTLREEADRLHSLWERQNQDYTDFCNANELKRLEDRLYVGKKE